MEFDNCSWSAADVLNIVNDGELVVIVRDIYLCVWFGGSEIEIYDITDREAIAEIELLAFGAERTVINAHEAIDEYFVHLDLEADSHV
tara:strand:- start:692 stop:955 length:264 start_codon:yes stop_codon:yes gene_type:complete